MPDLTQIYQTDSAAQQTTQTAAGAASSSAASPAPQGQTGGTVAAPATPVPAAPSGQTATAIPPAGGQQVNQQVPAGQQQQAAGQQTGQQQTAQQTAAEQIYVLNKLRELGYKDIPYKDDWAFTQDLLARQSRMEAERQQFEHFATYGRQMQSHHQEFQDFLKQKAQQAQQAQQQTGQQKPDDPWHRKYWSPPEYDPRWNLMMHRTETGELVPAQGAPPDIVSRYQNYMAWRGQKAQEFFDNPIVFMEGAMRHIAEDVAKKMLGEGLGQVQQGGFVKDYGQQNAAWLYQRDQHGNIVTRPQIDPATGSVVQVRQFSPEGQRFTAYVTLLEKAGIKDYGQQSYLAELLTQRDILESQAKGVAQPVGGQTNGTPAGAAPPQTPAQQNQTMKDQFQRSAAANGTIPAGGNQPALNLPQGQGRQGLMEMLQQALLTPGQSA